MQGSNRFLGIADLPFACLVLQSRLAVSAQPGLGPAPSSGWWTRILSLSPQCGQQRLRPLEQVARELRQPKTWVINEALAAYFERENQRQRTYRETLEVLADVEAGRLTDGDQVMAWIESRGADDELPSPQGCVMSLSCE